MQGTKTHRVQCTKTHKELCIIGVAGLLIILCTSGFISSYSATTLNPAQYFFIATSLWLFGCWQTWRRIELNRPHPNAPQFPNLGWANQLTLLRGGLIALTGGFLLQPVPLQLAAWIPGILYGIAATLDRIDGFVARRTQRTSMLGSELDTVFDALGLLVAPVLAIQLGKLHWSFFAVSLAYYLFVFGLYWRQKHFRPVYPLLPSQLRRAFAGFQMGFVALVLLPAFSATITQLLGIAFMLPILIGFFIDWLVVSGRIDGTKPQTVNHFSRIDYISKKFLQPGLRVIIAILLLGIVHITIHQNLLIAILAGALAFLIISGTGARIAAFVLLLGAGFVVSQGTVIVQIPGESTKIISVYQTALLFATSWLLLLGPGNYCLWRGDDIWVNRQDGGQ